MKVFFIPLIALGFLVALESPLAAEWFLSEETKESEPTELKQAVSIEGSEESLK
jgi:hypothetical protein